MTHACTNPSHVIYNIFYNWHPLHDITYTFDSSVYVILQAFEMEY